MKNPLEILFGTEMVFRLRRRPSALKRVAGQSKTQLMAALHPDQHLEIGPESAAEVSEAYSRLNSATTEEFEQFVSEFLDNQGGRRKIEELKIKIRELEKRLSLDDRTGLINARDRTISKLQREIYTSVTDRNQAFSLAWQWIHTGIRIRGSTEKDKFSREVCMNIGLSLVEKMGYIGHTSSISQARFDAWSCPKVSKAPESLTSTRVSRLCLMPPRTTQR